ncbi:MAG: glycerol-3-phosphate dehydrogenase [Bacteroidetes bacterium HGW-Bacteroidetes-4]|jgi:glycerol-3-phosphate dehydrogenase|nr:MAG: glycerol-3-phosphate dehydrogenase [Bacteroidetes bacterium HGW-Bacteroidetes-4]
MNNSENFSSCKRDALIGEMEKKNFDLIIFGGGITGAGIALDAISRGLSVALIEQNDFASGTSSRSTKLVHGGLRYLEKLQLKFVAQLGKERKILHDNATHLVLPTPVYLPIFKGGQLNRVLSYIGLLIYDFLAGVKKEYKAHWVKKDRLLKKYPFIESKGLKGAYRYYEYRTNDGRLVIETVKKAAELGAYALNYCEVKQLLETNQQLCGAKFRDALSGRMFSVSGAVLVNATGPWCEQFMNQLDKPMPKSLYPTKGVHLVFPKERFPLLEAFYFDTHDKRMIFAIPRNNQVYLGTTDTPYQGDLRKPLVTDNDMAYLLKATNSKFTGLNLKKNDIISCWAGIRPLIQDPGKSPGEISRKEELFVSESGLISITGGKLTGFRLMAKTLVDKVLRKLNKPVVKCQTQNIRASGSDWENPPTVEKLIEIADARYDEAKQTGISVPDFKELFYRYGTNVDKITEKAYELRPTCSDTTVCWLKAELWYAVNFERVARLADFLIYRTEKVLFQPEWVEKQLIKVADIMAGLLSWDEITKQNEIDLFRKQWDCYRL